ncbi:MAG TPA: hypothetical protein VN436_03740 [Holophaga sp.]|nr:hypothetical protein [Holophaga sp.]
MPTNQSYLTLSALGRELSDRLYRTQGKKVHRSTIYRWIEQGLPVAERDRNGRMFFVLEDVLAWKFPPGGIRPSRAPL